MDFKKDIKDLYQEMIEEGSSGSHKSKNSIPNLLDFGIEHGLLSFKETKHGKLIMSKVDRRSAISVHKGADAHPFRKWVEKEYFKKYGKQIDLNSLVE